MPRDRDGTFSTALFERYSRSEKALVCALVEMVVCGVSTRKVAKITHELCGKEFSRSTVSRYAEQLDEAVAAWNTRPLEGAYRFVLVDAIALKVREEGQVRSRALMIATGVDERGARRILGCELGHAESGGGWSSFFSALQERGLAGVELVTSDAHSGLVSAIEGAFPGALWQRCQTHFRRNVSEAAPVRHRGRAARRPRPDPEGGRQERGASRARGAAL